MSKTVIKTVAEDLLPELNKAILIVPKNTPMPILENFVLDFRKGKSFVIANNFEQTLKLKIEASCDEEISFLVPAYLFTNLVSNLSGNLDIEVQKSKAVIKSKNGQYNLSISLETDDFPELPKLKKNDEILAENIGAELFLDNFDEVEYAMSKDDIRPAMCGVFIEPDVNTNFVATNGVQLSLRQMNSETKLKKVEGFIIPTSAVMMMRKILPGESTIALSEGRVFFYDDDLEFTTRLIGDKYPKYESVIPKDNKYSVITDCAELITVVKRLRLFQDKDSSINLKFGPGQLILKISNTITGNEAEETIECEHNLPEDYQISFKPEYLLQTLQSFNVEKIKIKLSEPSKAAIITNPRNEENISLLMPVRQQEVV